MGDEAVFRGGCSGKLDGSWCIGHNAIGRLYLERDNISKAIMNPSNKIQLDARKGMRVSHVFGSTSLLLSVRHNLVTLLFLSWCNCSNKSLLFDIAPSALQKL